MSDATNVDWSGFVTKKAFKVLAKSNWKRRWLHFDGAAFSLAWSASEKAPPKSTFELDANDVEYHSCDDHKKPFEVKVSSKGSTLFFCLESADAVNRLMARLDAARRLKVASIENNGSVFQTEEAVAGAGSGIAPGEQGTKVMSWGVGILLGIGKDGINGMSVPQRIKDLRAGAGLKGLSSGPEHAAALVGTSALMWGSNEFYQLSQPQDVSSASRPGPVPSLADKVVLSIACGGSHTLAVVGDGAAARAGALFAWGTGTVGQLGVGAAAQILDAPARVELVKAAAGAGGAGAAGAPTGAAAVASVYAGLVSSAAISATGDAYVWGDASAGRLGLPRIPDLTPPGEVPTFVNGTLVWSPARLDFDAAALGLGRVDYARPVSIALGGAFSLFLLHTGAPGPGCVLLSTGALGVDITRDSYGYPPKEEREVQGMIDDEVKEVPRLATPALVKPFGPRNVVLDVVAGARHAAVVALDDKRGAPRLFIAGKGWLGLEEDLDSVLLEEPDVVASAFFPVAGLLADEDVVQAACGHSHTLARAADGRVYAWGRGDSGELGAGNLSDRSMPALARPVEGHAWTFVAAGSYYSLGTVEPSYGPSAPPLAETLEGFKAKWAAVAKAQADAIKAAAAPAPAPAPAAAAPPSPAAAKAAAAGKADGGKAAKEAAAKKEAKEQLDAGELPPGWNWDQTDDGEVYYLMPDGETQWEDPRDDWETYWKFFLKE